MPHWDWSELGGEGEKRRPKVDVGGVGDAESLTVLDVQLMGWEVEV